MILLRQKCTVYGEHATTKQYTVSLKTGLRCLLAPISGAQSVESRAQLNTMRRFFWDATYILPDYCQIDIDGQRWNPVFESVDAVKGNNGNRITARVCDVVKNQ